MPGSIQTAYSSAVLPWGLCVSFAKAEEYSTVENTYRGGECQRSPETTNSRKRWRLAKRLTPDRLEELRIFYEARNGPTEPFYFYDPYETVPKFSHDPTGAVVAGRYIVRFDCAWEQSCNLGRSGLSIELIEVA